jgi:Fe2+ or Zn2+ uptake regulation protein
MMNKFKAVLKEHGRSVTKSRLLLFGYLQEQDAVTVKQFLDDNLAIADRASLYRALQLFKEVGVVEERFLAGRRLIELTDLYDAHHHHLCCRRCGTATAVDMPEVEAALLAFCKARGFCVDKHLIEADGLCANCSKQRIPH